jgi:hypothetical protein
MATPASAASCFSRASNNARLVGERALGDAGAGTGTRTARPSPLQVGDMAA